MGGGGAIQDMINRNKANRTLAKSRFNKFEKRNTLLGSSGDKEGFQFKTPDPEEVAALRARLELEKLRDYRRLWSVTVFSLGILAYILFQYII